ncbi:MAG: inorganic diphosphatase [Firmicutes bacterium]|nr:inorganic diphosphatase [Bacillota bacterium]
MNPWHDICEKRITTEKFVAVTEIEKCTKIKYEIDKETGLLKLDRYLQTSTCYPATYGFIPKTLSEDGDPLDVLVLDNLAVRPMTLIDCAPIGVIEMIDNGARDEKIIAVPLYKNSPYAKYKDVTEVPQQMIREISHFLRVYKDLEEDKVVEIKPTKGRDEAIKVIKEAIALYKKTFKK